MTRYQLKALVSYWLDDLKKTYFTDDQINVFLNNAQEEVSKQLIQAGEAWYDKVAIRDTIAQQADYILPCDFRKLSRLEIVTNIGTVGEGVVTINSITKSQQDVFARVGFPQAYFLRSNRLILVPRPLLIHTMRMQYVYRVTNMSNDTDVPNVPEEYHECLAILAAYDGMIKDGRDVSALTKKIEAYQLSLKRDADERRNDSARKIVSTTFDGIVSF